MLPGYFNYKDTFLCMPEVMYHELSKSSDMLEMFGGLKKNRPCHTSLHG